MAEEIQRLPEFLRPEEPSDLSDMRLLLPAGCAHKAVAARAEEGVPQGPGALVAEAPDPTGVEHQAKMLGRVRKFVATSLNGTKDGESGDRAAVKMLMETTEGDSLLTFSTVHPKTGQQHTAKGGYYTCDLCNKTNKYDDGAACIAHVCGPAHIEKWLQANENTLETKDSLQAAARMPLPLPYPYPYPYPYPCPCTLTLTRRACPPSGGVSAAPRASWARSASAV